MGLIINGESVDELTLEEEFDAIKEHHERLGEVVCCDRDEEFRGYAHENVVNRTLLRQEAQKRFGECSEEEIDQAIADLKVEHGGEEEFYSNLGIPADREDLIRGKVADTLQVNRVLSDEMGPNLEPKDKDLEKFYKDHIDQYLTQEEIRVLHIFVEPTSPQEAEASYEQLREARKELRGGADFETKAKELCKEDHELDLGFFARGTMLAELETVIFSLDVDEISPVLASHFGYHVFRLVERKEREPIPFSEVKEKVAAQYEADFRDGKINGLLDRLKEAATIEETEEEASEVSA